METLIGGQINYMPHGLGTIWQEMPVIRIPSLRRRSAWSDGKSVGGISVAMRVNDAAVSSALAPASCNRYHLGFPNRAHSRFPSTCAVPAQSEGFRACLNIIPSVMVLAFVPHAARHGAC